MAGVGPGLRLGRAGSRALSGDGLLGAGHAWRGHGLGDALSRLRPGDLLLRRDGALRGGGLSDARLSGDGLAGRGLTAGRLGGERLSHGRLGRAPRHALRSDGLSGRDRDGLTGSSGDALTGHLLRDGLHALQGYGLRGPLHVLDVLDGDGLGGDGLRGDRRHALGGHLLCRAVLRRNPLRRGTLDRHPGRGRRHGHAVALLGSGLPDRSTTAGRCGDRVRLRRGVVLGRLVRGGVMTAVVDTTGGHARALTRDGALCHAGRTRYLTHTRYLTRTRPHDSPGLHGHARRYESGGGNRLSTGHRLPRSGRGHVAARDARARSTLALHGRGGAGGQRHRHRHGHRRAGRTRPGGQRHRAEPGRLRVLGSPVGFGRRQREDGTRARLGRGGTLLRTAQSPTPAPGGLLSAPRVTGIGAGGTSS